jgi:hypothetical protein
MRVRPFLEIPIKAHANRIETVIELAPTAFKHRVCKYIINKVFYLSPARSVLMLPCLLTSTGLGGIVRGHSPYRTPTHRNIIPIHRNIIPALRNTILIYLSALHFLSFYVHSTPFPSLPSPFSIYIPLRHLVRVSSVYSLRNSLTRSVSCT